VSFCTGSFSHLSVATGGGQRPAVAGALRRCRRFPLVSPVWIVTEYTDMHRGMTELARQIQERLKRDLHAADPCLVRFARRFPVEEVIVALQLNAEQRLKALFWKLGTIATELRFTIESRCAL
jgi:hypothetical protein